MAPMTMKRTSCSLRTRRMSPNRNSGNGLASNPRGDDLSGNRIGDPFARAHVQGTIDKRVVGVVVVREPDGQLEAAGLDQLAKGLEAGVDAPALPPGDRRLRSTDGSAKLFLCQACAKASFA